MKLIATMPLRNEGWVCGLSLRVALTWCDEIVVLVHASTDDTSDIVLEVEREYPGRVHTSFVFEQSWTEMQHRQLMLDRARGRGATHIAIIDADEIITGNLPPFGAWRDTAQMLELPGYNLRSGINRYHTTGTWGRRWFSCVFRDDERLYWWQKGRNDEQFHHREPFGRTFNAYRPVHQGQGGILHLWGASDRRLKAKHALYKVSERLRWPEKSVEEIDRMYSWCFTGQKPDEPQSWLYASVPEEWWTPYADWMKYLDLHREPWQEAEVRKLVAKHGREAFTGLDLFGVE
jgi:glycosyltransferase involved in cell wall biosynthesis